MVMDLKQIERLMAVMGRTGMKRIALKQEGFEIELERECVGGSSPVYAPLPLPPAALAFSDSAEERKTGLPAKEESVGRFVTSPMVGTFYAASSPENPAFVKMGDEIEEGTVICIIEAMKVMNEVKAGMRGKVAEILLKNGDPVEFGTKILRIV